MDLLLSEDSNYDDSSISQAIDLKLTLQITTHSLPKKTQEYMNLLLQKYLNECDLSSYFNKVSFCLSEILFNAVKANVKRVYFEEKGLDINNKEDYDEGMKTFRVDTLENKDHYFEKLRASNLYVTLSLKIEKGELIIEVRNNSVMTVFEYERVKEKIAGFLEFAPEDFSESIIDDTEGAGLGLRTIMMTLNSFGLPGDNYQLYTEGNETVARLVV